MKKQITLTASYVGEGSKLFHVSALADFMECPNLWLVAAEDLESAFQTVIHQELANHDPSSFEDGMEGYEIGVFAG